MCKPCMGHVSFALTHTSALSALSYERSHGLVGAHVRGPSGGEGGGVMQALGVTEAEAVQQKRRQRRNVVVKVVVDQATHRAALLLADSSCLLVSLTAGSAEAPITVPAPCSNACFLHLQAYVSAVASSSTSGTGHKIGHDFSSSPSKAVFREVVERGTLKNTNGESHAPRVQELSEKESVGNLSAGNGRAKGQGLRGLRREFFVVLARPALGGSCTDLSAWSCVDPAFSCVDIELELRDKGGRSSDELHYCFSSRTFARLDAPHGLSVKMAASINVLVVYSSSAGKFWVIAGKWSDEIGEPAHPVMSKGVFGAGLTRKRLVLMKCAVLRCYGPVYSILVSPLHLFFGESKGIRVWTLRPLIKPGSSVNCTLQAEPRLYATPEHGSYLSNNTHDCERCIRGDRYQHLLESRSAAGRIYEKTSNGDGAKLDMNVDFMDWTGVAAMKRLPRKGLCCTSDFHIGASFAGIGNSRKPQLASATHSQSSSLRFWSLSALQEALKSDCLEHLPAEDRIAYKVTMGTGVIEVDNRNGSSSSCPAEHEGFPSQLMFNDSKSRRPQGDTLTSRLKACSSNDCTRNRFLKTGLRPRTPVSESHFVPSELEALPLASQLANENVLQQTGPSGHVTGSSVQSKSSLDSAGMCFVALGGKQGIVSSQCTSHRGPQLPPQLQVLDIRGLSLKEYAILDSKGEIHLLTLHDVSEELKLEALFPILNHLQITMHVTCFAVPPLLSPSPLAHRGFVSPASLTATRKLWISDGMYTVHTVILPEVKLNCGINSTTTQSTPAVSQAVFMKDRLDVLVTWSGDTVVALTEAADTVARDYVVASMCVDAVPRLTPKGPEVQITLIFAELHGGLMVLNP